METRQFSMKDALSLLGVNPPRIKRSQSQDEIDRMVEEWKANDLAEHFKHVRREAHPDKHGGSKEAEGRFKNLTTAYNEVKSNLKLRKPVPPPSRVAHCRGCNSARIPSDAEHCYDCGLAYRRDKSRTECPVCGTERNPTQAKFCHACGYDYQVADGLVERLRSMGFTKADIVDLENDGTLADWRRLPAFSKELEDAISLKLMYRRLKRGDRGGYGGLFGKRGFGGL